MSFDRVLRGTTRQLVTLGYHSIAQSGPPYLSVDPARFDRHLEILHRRGFASADRATLDRITSGSQPAGGRHVLITFDDGFRDNLLEALPRLEEHGFSATLFVLPPYLDSERSFDWVEVEERARSHPEVMRSMTWEMVERLAEAGWEIGSHTVSHPHLPALDDDELAQELLDSRRRIAERLGRCDTLSYPFGDWDERVRAAAAAAGYSFGFTLPFGAQRAVDRLSIPRVAVDHRDDARRFSIKLSAAARTLMFSQLRPLARRVLRRRPRGYAHAL